MEADFPLTEEGIREGLTGHMAYVRAAYTVMSSNGKYAVAKLNKGEGEGLFRKVDSVEIISLPEDTVFVEFPDMDVLNTPERAELQKKYPGKTIVVSGMFSHISFIHDLKYETLRIADSVPPYPSKMGMLVHRAFESGYVDLPLVTETFNAEMSEMIKDVKTEGVIFPCRVSGLKSDKPYYFLDTHPELKHEVTLIGCETSRRIFNELYGKDVPMINACPKDLCPRDGVKTIARCCKIRNGYVMDGDVALVPWGATVPEVAEAINALFR